MTRISHRLHSRILAIGLLLLPLSAQSLVAQTAEERVENVITSFFDAMRAGDAEALAALFHPDARLQTTGVREGQPILRTETVEPFIQAVGAPRTQVWDERVSDLEVRVDDHLATAWMNYSFYVDDRFSHCGVNALQLFDGGDGWRIIQVADTRRASNCAEDSG